MSKAGRKRHSPEQIIKKLRDADALLNSGKDLAAVLQSLQVSESTLERWRAQYGGMEAQEGKRLKELEDENRRLKRIVADQARSGGHYAKLYTSLSEAEVAEGIAAAHANGLRAVAHLTDVSWTRAAELGIDALVHMMPPSGAKPGARAIGRARSNSSNGTRRRTSTRRKCAR